MEPRSLSRLASGRSDLNLILDENRLQARSSRKKGNQSPPFTRKVFIAHLEQNERCESDWGTTRISPFGWERAFSHRRTTRPGQNLEVVPGRLGLPGDFVGLTCLTSRSTSARFVPYAVCSHARLSSKSGEPPCSCDPWRRHVDAALAEHIFGRGRARGRAGASAGTAVRAKRLRGERPALDSAE